MSDAPPRKSSRKTLADVLVQKGFAADKKAAEALTLSGAVFVDGKRALFSGSAVSSSPDISVAPGPEYVSRGGLKLAGALDTFHVDPAGKICCDVGASTGGFTDCLLRRGAASVYAFDVGKNLLHERLRRDSRVIPVEGFNFRYFAGNHWAARQDRDIVAAAAEKCELAVVDVSFISMRKILDALARGMKKDISVVALVKPQFELEAGSTRGGVVRDRSLAASCVDKIASCADSMGFVELGRAAAAIKGTKGNEEFFLYLSKRGGDKLCPQ